MQNTNNHRKLSGSNAPFSVPTSRWAQEFKMFRIAMVAFLLPSISWAEHADRMCDSDREVYEFPFSKALALRMLAQEGRKDVWLDVLHPRLSSVVGRDCSGRPARYVLAVMPVLNASWPSFIIFDATDLKTWKVFESGTDYCLNTLAEYVRTIDPSGVQCVGD